MDQARRGELLANYERAVRMVLLGDEMVQVGLRLVADFSSDCIAAGIEPKTFPPPPVYQPPSVEALRQVAARLKAEREGGGEG